ncbi:hypothetical protein SALBM217S_00765 [Streptomyces griseoloalbus]
MSSTTPDAAPAVPRNPADELRARLTEQRKAQTRLHIARTAAGLFVRHGLRATRAEDIAQAGRI